MGVPARDLENPGRRGRNHRRCPEERRSQTIVEDGHPADAHRPTNSPPGTHGRAPTSRRGHPNAKPPTSIAPLVEQPPADLNCHVRLGGSRRSTGGCESSATPVSDGRQRRTTCSPATPETRTTSRRHVMTTVQPTIVCRDHPDRARRESAHAPFMGLQQRGTLRPVVTDGPERPGSSMSRRARPRGRRWRQPRTRRPTSEPAQDVSLFATWREHEHHPRHPRRRATPATDCFTHATARTRPSTEESRQPHQEAVRVSNSTRGGSITERSP